MEKSQSLLEYLKRNCDFKKEIPQTESARFDYYKACIKLLPKECINESFLKVEDGYLAEQLKRQEIIEVEKLEKSISVQMRPAAFFSADAVLSFLDKNADDSVYLYSGTRFKMQLLRDTPNKEIAVFKAHNVFYKGIISASLLPMDTRLTSVLLNTITEKYVFSLNVARDNKLHTLVLSVPNIENASVNIHVAKAILACVFSHPYRRSLKIVISANSKETFDVYNKLMVGKEE